MSALLDAVHRMSLNRFVVDVKPGSQGDDWTWDDELRWLEKNHREPFERLLADVRDHGQEHPVVIGDDGRLWDGHHRVCALITIGRRWVKYVRYTDLTDDQKTDLLFQSIGDWERR